MKWLRRLFVSSNNDLQDAVKRIEQLEVEQKMVRAGMSSLQSALIAISTNQEGVASSQLKIP